MGVKKVEDNISIGVDIDTEKLQDASEILEEMTMPNITIRDNDNVNVTINYFNTSHKEYLKEE